MGILNGVKETDGYFKETDGYHKWRCRDGYFIAEQLAPAPHLATPEGRATLRSVLKTVPRISRSSCQDVSCHARGLVASKHTWMSKFEALQNPTSRFRVQRLGFQGWGLVFGI